VRQIRPLSSKDYHSAATLFANAYPVLNLLAADPRPRVIHSIEKNNQYPTVTFYGLFEQDMRTTNRLFQVAHKPMCLIPF
jgi:hypothetical protein